ncbi:ribonuclease H-like domain-containing protein [Tanacetum coccineum]
MTGLDTTNVTTLLSDKLSLVTHHHLLKRVSVKLDLNNWNYGSWEFFFDQLCYSYEVNKYIHGLNNETKSSTLTPLTPEELKVDKIVLSWIFTTLSDTLQVRLVVARPKSAKEAWDLITAIVKDNKWSRTSTLKAELRSIKLDVVHYAIEGLFDKYDQVCGIMHHKDTFPGLKTARSMLITEEMSLKSKFLALPVDSSSPMVHDPNAKHNETGGPKLSGQKTTLLHAFDAGTLHDLTTSAWNIDTDLGSLNYFLGISVTWDSSGMFFSQRKYVIEIVERTHMVNCNPSRTPVDTESKLVVDCDPVSNMTLYQSLTSSLQYVTFTRHGISYVVQQFCLYMHDPREPHFSALNGSLIPLVLQIWLLIQMRIGLLLLDNRPLVTVFLGNNLLSCSSKRQPTLSHSSAEAEYHSVANVVAETCWLRKLLHELYTTLSSATRVYCDNVSAVYLSSNPVQHQRTNHIEIDIHFVRDLVAAVQIRVLHVPSRYQFANIFTKGLSSALFEEFRSSLSIRCSLAPTAEEC